VKDIVVWLGIASKTNNRRDNIMENSILLNRIVEQIEINNTQTDNDKYYEGANDALEELAVYFNLVENYGVINKQKG
jgi:hypothetical protein